MLLVCICSMADYLDINLGDHPWEKLSLHFLSVFVLTVLCLGVGPSKRPPSKLTCLFMLPLFRSLLGSIVLRGVWGGRLGEHLSHF